MVLAGRTRIKAAAHLRREALSFRILRMKEHELGLMGMKMTEAYQLAIRQAVERDCGVLFAYAELLASKMANDLAMRAHSDHAAKHREPPSS